MRCACLATVCIAALSSCASAPLAQPTPAQVARAQARNPHLPPNALQTGRELFSNRCTRCHAAPSPNVAPPGGWSAELARMGPRAHLSDEQLALVAAYLETVQPD